MGKRRFMSALAGLGLSRGVVEHLTQDELADLTADPTDRVPRVQRYTHTNHDAVTRGAPPEREAVFTTIPRDKWVRVESAHDAADRVAAALADIAGDDSIPVGVTTGVDGHHRRYQVVVDYPVDALGGETVVDASYQQVADAVPASIAGQAGDGDNAVVVENIPVVVRRVHGNPTSNFRHKYRPVPGGCKIEDQDGNDCTTCTPAYDNDRSENVLVTAGHCFDFASGHDTYQPDTATSYGHVGMSDKAKSSYDYCSNLDFDAATVTLDLENDVKYAIAGTESGSDYDWPIHGAMAWDTIKDMTSCDTKMRRQGEASGREKTCVDSTYTNKTFSLEKAATGGDSGGPLFRVYHTPDGFAAYLAGVTACNYAPLNGTDNNSKATYIGKVENEFNLTV
jgi:hypothetical protein